MEPRDLHNWAENLEAGRENDPDLRLAARLRSSASFDVVAPEELRTALRQRLLVQYDIEPEIAEQLRARVPAAPTLPSSLRDTMRQSLLASYDVDAKLADRLRLAAPDNGEIPASLRIELRRRLLSSYQKLGQMGRRVEVRRANRRRPSLRLATTIVTLFILLWVSGGINAGVTWAERIFNRIFVTDKVVPTPVAIPTLEATRAVEVKRQVAREQTAIAESKKLTGLGYTEISKFQAKVPFTISIPTHLPKEAVLEYVQDISDENGPGIQFRYKFTDRKFLQITEQQPVTVRTIAVERDSVVQEFQLKDHPAIIYSAGEIPGRPKMLFLEWTDGVIWLEMFTTLDDKELAKIAESMVP
jgi:hypothetical protein